MIFFLQHLKSGHPFICYHFPEQILQPHLFLQTDDAFTDRAIILMLFDGSGRRERWHHILLKNTLSQMVGMSCLQNNLPHSNGREGKRRSEQVKMFCICDR